MEIIDVEIELDTSVDQGLTSDVHTERLEACGPNKIPEQPGATILDLLWVQINSMVIYILIVGALFPSVSIISSMGPSSLVLL